ncbi:MFS transporter [Flavimaricola marinus]|uniref:Major Facilitator Superfamily protein n=1 Tax=Flavimaricola marinus TaxID=1819565 RepID=A0A238LAU9_9RHOB|nr:MFS transporter [Flavimaricola marinus]SMY06721.1 Major Facilitator Superfamily protein [Flavimaricola marinus]
MQNIALIWRDPTLRMLGLATLIFGSLVASFSPYVSLLGIQFFGLSDGGYALVLTGSLLVSVTASVIVGIVTDQRPARKAMAAVAALSSIAGLVLVTIAPSTLTFVFAHLLFLPLGSTLLGQIFAIARLHTAEMAEADRDGVTAVIRALFAVPFALLLPLWGMAFNAEVSLLVLYPTTLAMAVALLAMVLWIWPSDGAAPWTEQKSGLGFFASLAEVANGPISLRLLAMGAVHSGSTLMAVLLALVFTETAGRGSGDAAIFFGAFVALEICVMLSVGVLVRRYRRLHIIAAGAANYALFMGLFPGLAPTGFVWLLILPVSVGGGLIYSLSISYLQDLLGARAGAGASLVALQRMVSEGLAAAIFALGAVLGGYDVAAYIGAVTILIGTAALLLLDDGPRR